MGPKTPMRSRIGTSPTSPPQSGTMIPLRKLRTPVHVWLT